LGLQTTTREYRKGRGTFLASLVAVCVLVAVDLILQADVILVELLVVGPVIAAFGASARQTAVVALVALLVSIPLGLAGDAFLSTEHVIAIAAVALVGVLAAGIAWLRSARERDAAQLAVQYGVARVLAEADSLETAAPGLVEAIAAPLGFEVGHLWESRRPGMLRAVGSWTAPGVDVRGFEEATRRLHAAPGQGLPGQVWQTSEPAWLQDVMAQGNFLRAVEAERDGLSGGLAFPVCADGRAVAVIELFSRTPLERDPELVALTEAIGALVGEFIDGLRAADAVRISDARKSAVVASSLDGVITIDHGGKVLEFNPAAEAMFGRTSKDAIGAELAELVIPPALRARHRAALRRVVETGESTLLGRRVELTGMRADGSEFPVELAITRIGVADPPMFTGTVRDVTDRRTAEAEREDLLRLEQLARVEATEARDQLRAILSGVADAVTAQAPDGRLLFANDAAVELLGFESREALLSAELAEIMARFEVLDETGATLPFEQLPGRQALAEGEPSELVVRFRVRETGEERWSAVKATPIKDATGAVTMAINVIEDITQHKRAERAQRFLSESSAVLGTSLDRQEVLGQVATLAVPEVADWLFVDMVVEGRRFERVAVAHSDPTQLRRAEELHRDAPPRPDAPGGVAHVLRTGRSELHPDLPQELAEARGELAYFRLARAFRMRSAIIVPMRARGRTLGALTFATGPSGRRFDEQDLALAEELARRCATAIDNARLFSERAYIARTLQQSLLPAELPDIPGLETAARFRPTGEGNEVGGDFYDLFKSGGRGWTVVMGDVCGKGPDAAAVTALARYTLRAAAMRERLPSRSLQLLNEALLRQRDDRRFCTVAYAYLERRGDGVQIGFASGGHPLPMLVRPDGSVEEVGEPGTLLGVLPDPRFEDRSLVLAPGEALVFYTDGVIEGRGGDGALDERSLAELLGACGGSGADAIAARVEDAAVTGQGGRPRDDIAVLVLRVAA